MVKQIVERFEKKGYSDDNEDDREYIVERMQRVSSAALTT
jgi:peroxin-19